MLELGVLALFILEEEAPTGIWGKPICPPEFHVKIFLLNDAFIDTGQYGIINCWKRRCSSRILVCTSACRSSFSWSSRCRRVFWMALL
jgi:hypothetical protein